MATAGAGVEVGGAAVAGAGAGSAGVAAIVGIGVVTGVLAGAAVGVGGGVLVATMTTSCVQAVSATIRNPTAKTASTRTHALILLSTAPPMSLARYSRSCRSSLRD